VPSNFVDFVLKILVSGVAGSRWILCNITIQKRIINDKNTHTNKVERIEKTRFDFKIVAA
jgi:hypothetical protein